jgi:hypothetical protein
MTNKLPPEVNSNDRPATSDLTRPLAHNGDDTQTSPQGPQIQAESPTQRGAPGRKPLFRT